MNKQNITLALASAFIVTSLAIQHAIVRKEEKALDKKIALGEARIKQQFSHTK